MLKVHTDIHQHEELNINYRLIWCLASRPLNKHTYNKALWWQTNYGDSQLFLNFFCVCTFVANLLWGPCSIFFWFSVGGTQYPFPQDLGRYVRKIYQKKFLKVKTHTHNKLPILNFTKNVAFLSLTHPKIFSQIAFILGFNADVILLLNYWTTGTEATVTTRSLVR